MNIVIHEAAELAEQLARTLREAQHEAQASGDLASGELFVELMENLERIFRGHQRSFSQDVENLCRSWRTRNLSARGCPPNSLGASLVRDLADTVQSLVQRGDDMPLSRYSFTVLCQEILETWQQRGDQERDTAERRDRRDRERSEAFSASDRSHHGDSKSKASASAQASSCFQSDACVDLLVALEELVWQNSRGEEFRSEVARVCRCWKDRHSGESLPDNAGIVLLLKSLSDLLRAAVSGDDGKVQRGRRACSNLLNALKKLFSDGRQRPGGSLANEISHVCRTWQTGECVSATSESAVLVRDIADVLQAEALHEASNTLAAMSYGTEEILPQKECFGEPAGQSLCDPLILEYGFHVALGSGVIAVQSALFSLWKAWLFSLELGESQLQLDWHPEILSFLLPVLNFEACACNGTQCLESSGRSSGVQHNVCCACAIVSPIARATVVFVLIIFTLRGAERVTRRTATRMTAC